MEVSQSKFEQRKEQIKQTIKRLEEELKAIDIAIDDPNSYCDKVYTEEDYIKHDMSGYATNEELTWLKANIGKRLEHDYQRDGHFRGVNQYGYKYCCRHCGDTYTNIHKR